MDGLLIGVHAGGQQEKDYELQTEVGLNVFRCSDYARAGGQQEKDYELQTEVGLNVFRCSDYASWNRGGINRFTAVDCTTRRGV